MAKNTKTTSSSNMNEEQEKKLASWIYTKFKDAVSAKEDITAEWMEYMNAWNNSLYDNQGGADYKSNHVSNLIFSTIESMRPIMFDGNPNFEAVPLTKEALPYCRDVNNIFDYEWRRTGMRKKLMANSIYTLCLGTSIIMLPYTYDGDNPEGDVTPIEVNPFNLYPDPLATSVDDAEYLMYATYVHENKLKQRYPDRAEAIEGGKITYEELITSQSDSSSVDNQVLLIECWCRDYTSMEDVEDEDGNTSQQLKYPLGRVIISAPELNLVFEDKENPYESGRFPFFIFKDIDVPFQFWGEGEIKWLLSPQKAINDLSNQIIDNAKATANMQWIIDKNSGIPKGQLTNRPGLVVRKNPGSEVRRDSPPSMPMYVSEMISRLEHNIEVISGVHDATIGRNPGRVESGTAIIALQEAAQTRIRMKVSLLEETLGELGTEWLNRIKQFWKTNRLIPVQKTETEQIQPYSLVGNEMQQVGAQDPMMMQNPSMLGTSMSMQQGVTQPYDFISVNQNEQLAQAYRIQVHGGKGFALNRSSMLETMLSLISTPAEDGMPVVPREAVLDYLPDVNKQVILDYFGKLKAERMALEQQQQGTNEMMNQIQMMNEQLSGTTRQVDSLSQRAQQEDDARARDEIMTQGYQQGLNASKAMNTVLDKSGQMPQDLINQLSSLSDNELAMVLQENPDLAKMI